MFLLEEYWKDVSMSYLWELFSLFIYQTLALTRKHFVQKVTGYNRRKFVGDVFITPMFVVGAIGALTAFFVSVATIDPAYYERTGLVRIDQLFKSSENNVVLYYTPNTHAGVNSMMKAFQDEFTDAKISVIGAPDVATYTTLFRMGGS